MHKVVLDTNVLVSAMLSSNGTPSKILDLFLDGELELYYSYDIFKEYHDVLLRPKFKIATDSVHGLLEVVKDSGILINPSKSNFQMRDESDRKFYDAAKDSKSWLVTGNIKDFPQDSFVVIPKDFLEKVIFVK